MPPMGVSKNFGGKPSKKWMVSNGKTYFQMDDLVVKNPYFWFNTPHLPPTGSTLSGHRIDSWAHLGGTVAGVAVRAARPPTAAAGAASVFRWQRMARGAKMLAVMVGLGGKANMAKKMPKQ